VPVGDFNFHTCKRRQGSAVETFVEEIICQLSSHQCSSVLAEKVQSTEYEYSQPICGTHGRRLSRNRISFMVYVKVHQLD
jgi:hypothetical protein